MRGISAYSFSGFMGIESPIYKDQLFTNFGIHIKLSLSNYSQESAFVESYYPFFIGLRLGLNFRFHWL